MAGQTLDIESFLVPDQLGMKISETYQTWESSRQAKVAEWQEVQLYLFATDTTKTTNSKLPWSNKTSIPKLCQIRDNLHANYMATLFPKQKWLEWEGNDEQADDVASKEAIESYMSWVTDRNEFYSDMSQLVYDFIDYGNCFAMPEWEDGTYTLEDEAVPQDRVGYVGPGIMRISPLDIVFNPVATSFEKAPKIVRSLISMGELKEIIEREVTTDDDREVAQELFSYFRKLRNDVTAHGGNLREKDQTFAVAGFDSFRSYLQSDTIEVLTYYGDMYDKETDTFNRNQVITVVDRHKVVDQKVHPSIFGRAPIHRAGWRNRPDNLWAMGPLDNLVGMQYRIDHLENMKADVFDLIAYPPLKIKGYVEDFDWAPMERILVGDDGDVDLMSPNVQALQADNQIALLEAKMEEMAGSPKEAMGFRTPGEKTAFEVQRLENAASRIFQNKTSSYERDFVEPLVNAQLELARRNMSPETIRIFDDELKIAVFTQISAQDLTGNGRIKPVAARNFAEKATQAQNLNNFFSSSAGQDPEVRMHFSSVKLAHMWEDILDIEHHNVVSPYVRLAEQSDAERLMVAHQEQAAVDGQTPSGLFEDDADGSFLAEDQTEEIPDDEEGL